MSKATTSRGKKSVPISADDKYYKMDHENRGKAIIFNQESFKDGRIRKGTKKDAKDIEAVLSNLKFDVKIYQDLKSKEIENVLKTLSKEDHTNNDCLVVVVMSHGNETSIGAYDEPYRIDNLWKNFTVINCPGLKAKPKLFFIQACRGNKSMKGGGEVVGDSRNYYILPDMADILVMFSTVKDYVSVRDLRKGTWFIQCLCAELENYAESDDLLSILTSVNRKMAIEYETENGDKQIGCIQSSLTRTLQFYKD